MQRESPGLSETGVTSLGSRIVSTVPACHKTQVGVGLPVYGQWGEVMPSGIWDKEAPSWAGLSGLEWEELRRPQVLQRGWKADQEQGRRGRQGRLHTSG